MEPNGPFKYNAKHFKLFTIMLYNIKTRTIIMEINFNKIYVIQSLPNNELQTGTQLYDDIIQRFDDLNYGQTSQLYDVKSQDLFFSALENINDECKQDNVMPIIHFEIHGSEDQSGFILSNGILVKWEDIYSKLTDINISCRWNLFITMAVCYGNYAMILMKPDRVAPFKGILGPFDTILVSDLTIMFEAFYQSLLRTKSLDSAINQLNISNPELNSKYKLLSAEHVFQNVYQNYLNTQFSDYEIELRIEDSIREDNINFENQNDRDEFSNRFRNLLFQTQEEYFQKAKETFFMIDIYPEHSDMYCKNWIPNFN